MGTRPCQFWPKFQEKPEFPWLIPHFPPDFGLGGSSRIGSWFGWIFPLFFRCWNFPQGPIADLWDPAEPRGKGISGMEPGGNIRDFAGSSIPKCACGCCNPRECQKIPLPTQSMGLDAPLGHFLGEEKPDFAPASQFLETWICGCFLWKPSRNSKGIVGFGIPNLRILGVQRG